MLRVPFQHATRDTIHRAYLRPSGLDKKNEWRLLSGRHSWEKSTRAIAARAAGCHVFCVPYGYNEGRNVYELDCDAIVETLIEASKLISK